jgi:hypothetical protein
MRRQFKILRDAKKIFSSDEIITELGVQAFEVMHPVIELAMVGIL